MASLRLGRAALIWLRSCALAMLALQAAQAQPKLPDPSLPTLPTTPEVPALPVASPAKTKGGTEASDKGGAASQKEVPSAPQGPSAIVDGPATEIDLQIDDRRPQASDGLPASLPSALRKSARPKGANSSTESTPTGLTLEEVVNPPVSSVSNSVEGALKAPAWMIILTSRDLINRGYTDLSQILDDLPGMDVIRTYGVDYVRSYARGYRSDVGKDPYLILIDGQPYASIFFDDSQILTAIPLSNIDHVEIVYGPASVVHGANAATGLINIVTVDGSAQQQKKDFGSHEQVRMSYGGAQRNLTRFADTTKVVDATASWVHELWRVRVTARVERSVLDRSIGDNFEFTRNKYYSDPSLWGQGVLNTFPDRAGKFRSSNDKLALDARLAFGGLELGGALMVHNSGFGTEYVGDRYQAQGSWVSQEASAWLRYVAHPLPMLTSTSLLRYRQSDVSPSSFYLYRVDANSTTPAGVLLENEAVNNHSFEFEQQFDANVAKDLILRGDELKLTAGVSLRDLEVSNSIQTTASVLYPMGDVTMPQDQIVAGDVSSLAGHHAATSAGVFLLGSYALSSDHLITAGARVQHQNDQHFKLSTTPLVLRAAYVGTFGPVIVKALYGEATVAPSLFELSTAMTKLHNESTSNLELNGTLMLGPVSVTLSGWHVRYSEPIVFNTVSVNNFAFNAQAAQATGLDAGARLFLKPVQVWLYYSRYFQNEVQVTAKDAWHDIGDLARDKLWAGVTYEVSRFSATLLGRFIGRRYTPPTNPLGSIPGYLSLDINLLFKDLFFDGGSLSFRCTNLLDMKYSQPGIGAADSGIDPSVPDHGELSSALPQPRRSLYLTLLLDL